MTSAGNSPGPYAYAPPPTWGPPPPPPRSMGTSVIAVLLMLPVALILLFFILWLGLLHGVLGYGDVLLLLLLVIVVMMAARILFFRSRRRHRRQWAQQHRPVQILRERYARGEITREQFFQIVQDLRPPQRPPP